MMGSMRSSAPPRRRRGPPPPPRARAHAAVRGGSVRDRLLMHIYIPHMVDGDARDGRADNKTSLACCRATKYPADATYAYETRAAAWSCSAAAYV